MNIFLGNKAWFFPLFTVLNLSCRAARIVVVTDADSGDSYDDSNVIADEIHDWTPDHFVDGMDIISDIPEIETDFPSDTQDDDSQHNDCLLINDFNPLPPSRPPTSCGSNCRQVTFTDESVQTDIIGVNEWYLSVFSVGSFGTNDKIWLVDLATLNQQVIAEAVREGSCQSIVRYSSLYDRVVNFVFTRMLETSIISDIYSYDITSSHSNIVYSMNFISGTAPISQMTIFGEYLSWWDGRLTPSTYGGQAFLYNTEEREEKLLSPDGCCATNTRMFGNYVVWAQGSPGAGQQIWVHDINESRSYQVSEGSRDKFSPYIYDSKVLWAECFVDGCDAYTGKSADIVLKDLLSGETVRITDDVQFCSFPVMWGDIVAWSDCRSDPRNSSECWTQALDIYMKDLSSNDEWQLTNIVGSERTIGMFGNKVYFIKYDAENILSVFESTF